MKAPTLLLCVLPAASGFIPSVVVSRTSLPDRRQRTTIAQIATVAIDTPRTLPKGKRIVRRKKRQPSQPKHVDTANAPVTLIKSKAEYDEILRHNINSLVVIKFFAPWCRSCKALDVKYRRMAVENDDVKFVEIDVHQSPDLKKVLGVRAVPTVKLHAGPLGQVASFTCGPRKAPELARKIQLCKDVPALTARLGKGSGMIEMLADELNSDKPVAASSLPQPGREVRSAESVIAKGLMEKVAHQEMAESSQRTLDEVPTEDRL
ncbi:unnamed protein product [Ectocarpus sp. CCAP 1310/34]|nr:unnamed protein product [Ectocarpus sp. CCAP 1310/34]